MKKTKRRGSRRAKKKMTPQVRAMLAALKRSRRRARVNPPKRQRRRSRAAGGPSLHVTRLGKVKSITYTHAVDGKLYRHGFGRGTNVAYSRDGKMVLWPVRIQPFIGDHQ